MTSPAPASAPAVGLAGELDCVAAYLARDGDMPVTAERLRRIARQVAELEAAVATPATEGATEPDLPLDALELAWGIIANAGGGDWERETTEWQEAAARWRDTYLGRLMQRRALATPGAPIPRAEGVESALRTAVVRLGILRDRMAGCEEQHPDTHRVTLIEVPAWIAEAEAVLAAPADAGGEVAMSICYNDALLVEVGAAEVQRQHAEEDMTAYYLKRLAQRMRDALSRPTLTPPAGEVEVAGDLLALSPATGLGRPGHPWGLRAALVAAMQAAWDDFADDTGCFPDCIKIERGRGVQLSANFDASNFALFVAGELLPVLQADRVRALAAQAREAEGLRGELRQARADHWEMQAALSEIKCLVPLDESTTGPKAGWAGVVERVRCHKRAAEAERDELRARVAELEGLRELAGRVCEADAFLLRDAAELYDAKQEAEGASTGQVRDAIWRGMQLRIIGDWLETIRAAAGGEA